MSHTDQIIGQSGDWHLNLCVQPKISTNVHFFSIKLIMYFSAERFACSPIVPFVGSEICVKRKEAACTFGGLLDSNQIFKYLFCEVYGI